MASPTITTAQLFRLADSELDETIQQSDVATILSDKPFLRVSGSFNMRDLGWVPGSPIRSDFAFRSGMLDRSAADNLAVLSQTYGIKWIFDLRSHREHSQSPDPDIAGITGVWLPGSQDYIADVRDFISGGGEDGYCKMYMTMMESYASSFKEILEHVRDRPEEPFLIHCTYGRDRTGIASAMLLSLAGASTETVMLDYMLSRIGLEPVKETLLARALSETGCESLEIPGVYNLCSLRLSSWNAFMDEFQKVYGGFEGYAVSRLGFDQSDLLRIKENLQKR